MRYKFFPNIQIVGCLMRVRKQTVSGKEKLKKKRKETVDLISQVVFLYSRNATNHRKIIPVVNLHVDDARASVIHAIYYKCHTICLPLYAFCIIAIYSVIV